MTDKIVSPQKRRFLVASTALLGGVGLITAAVPFVESMAPSARERSAGGPVEVDLGKIEPGMLLTVVWRGKPVWILYRTAAMLAMLDTHDSQLRDPESDVAQQPGNCKNPTRSIKPKYFVAVGICTHLGCSPTLRERAGESDMGSDWPGGWFCPCHGSTFDLAGRVFKGVPAPLNLVVPYYRYLSETRLQIGNDSA